MAWRYPSFNAEGRNVLLAVMDRVLAHAPSEQSTTPTEPAVVASQP
jgi:hypothetical protein